MSRDNTKSAPSNAPIRFTLTPEEVTAWEAASDKRTADAINQFWMNLGTARGFVWTTAKAIGDNVIEAEPLIRPRDDTDALAWIEARWPKTSEQPEKWIYDRGLMVAAYHAGHDAGVILGSRIPETPDVTVDTVPGVTVEFETTLGAPTRVTVIVESGWKLTRETDSERMARIVAKRPQPGLDVEAVTAALTTPQAAERMRGLLLGEVGRLIDWRGRLFTTEDPPRLVVPTAPPEPWNPGGSYVAVDGDVYQFNAYGERIWEPGTAGDGPMGIRNAEPFTCGADDPPPAPPPLPDLEASLRALERRIDLLVDIVLCAAEVLKEDEA